jgi:hypothetical protein
MYTRESAQPATTGDSAELFFTGRSLRVIREGAAGEGGRNPECWRLPTNQAKRLDTDPHSFSVLNPSRRVQERSCPH